MSLILQLILLSISTTVLAKSSHVVVNSSMKISKMTRLGQLVMGFIVLSVATSLPELSISTSAILSHEVGVSIGNIFGSNVTNICLLIGIIAMIRCIKIKIRTLKSLSTILFLSSLIPLILINLSFVSRIVGVVLLSLFFGFCYYSIKKKIVLHKTKNVHVDFFKDVLFSFEFHTTVISLILGLIGIILSSNFAVNSASNIADALNISKSIIGATIIAIGTSLPELSVSLTAVKKGYTNLALGNVIGSCLTNLTLVLGTSLLLSPLVIKMAIFDTLITFGLISTLLLWFFFTKGSLDQTEGILLLTLYVTFIIVIFGVEISSNFLSM